jgi:hypothetical protein
MKTTKNINQVAEILGRKVWAKQGDNGLIERIYFNEVGYNTKKVSTKAYIYLKPTEKLNVIGPSGTIDYIQEYEICYSAYVDGYNVGPKWCEQRADEAKSKMKEIAEDKMGRALNPANYEHEAYMPYTKRVKSIASLIEQVRAGFRVSFNDKNRTELADHLNEVSATIYGDGSGSFHKRKEGEPTAAEAIAKHFAPKHFAPKPEATPLTPHIECGKEYMHAKFGKGVLLAEDEGTITLRFECGEKKLLKKFAKIKIC